MEGVGTRHVHLCSQATPRLRATHEQAMAASATKTEKASRKRPMEYSPGCLQRQGMDCRLPCCIKQPTGYSDDEDEEQKEEQKERLLPIGSKVSIKARTTGSWLLLKRDLHGAWICSCKRFQVCGTCNHPDEYKNGLLQTKDAM